MENNEINVFKNREDNGANRCPKCGASEITYDIKKGKLICNYCHIEFEASDVEGIEKEARNLKGEKRAKGTEDIKDKNDVLTLKCNNCGAEVVINTKEQMNARCHWCRSILSVNSKLKNGSIPDFVLPFKIEKQEAEKNIETFVKERMFFADSKFKKEFKADNIMGVYFPYLLIDANCHATFSGEGGEVARKYEIVVGKDKDGKEQKKTVYDIDVYSVVREFDIAIDDLSVESSRDKLDKHNKKKTTNIINAIMPFDTENCIKYEANYLAGYTSEKRDVNVDDLKDKVEKSLKDVARHSINNDLKQYDAGVAWDTENLEMNGQQWTSSYLPVWLYSCQDRKKRIHYVAVNGRTGQTQGSVPINKAKLAFWSLVIFIISNIFLLISYMKNAELVITPFTFIPSMIGFVSSIAFYFSKANKYRNKNERYNYEKETKNTITNLKRMDEESGILREQTYPRLGDANNTEIEGEYTGVKSEE